MEDEKARDFNQKFQPVWLPRSIVVEDAAQAPRVGLLFASIEGFVNLPVLGRLFAPPPVSQSEGR